MKKFLTVLLALSVVFTYTVGSAFALPSDGTDQAGLNAAKAEALEELNDQIGDVSEYTSVGQVIAAGIVAKYTATINDADNISAVETAVDALKKEISNLKADYLTDAVNEAIKNAQTQIKDYMYLFGYEVDNKTFNLDPKNINNDIIPDGNVKLDALTPEDEDDFVEEYNKQVTKVANATSVTEAEEFMNDTLKTIDKYMSTLASVAVTDAEIQALVDEIIKFAKDNDVNTEEYSSTIVNQYDAMVEEAVAAAKAVKTKADYYEVIDKYLGSLYNGDVKAAARESGATIHPSPSYYGWVVVLNGSIYICENTAGELNKLINKTKTVEAQIKVAEKVQSALGDYNYQDIAKDQWKEAEKFRLGIASFIESGATNELPATDNLRDVITSVDANSKTSEINAAAEQALTIYAGYTKLAAYKADAINKVNSFAGYEYDKTEAKASDSVYDNDTLAQIDNLQELYANYINIADSYDVIDSYVDAYKEKVDTYNTIKEDKIADDYDDIAATIDKVVEDTIGAKSLTADQTTLINRIVADFKAKVKSGEAFPFNWDATAKDEIKVDRVKNWAALKVVRGAAGKLNSIDAVVNNIVTNTTNFSTSSLYGYDIIIATSGDAYAIYDPANYGLERNDLEKYAGYLADAAKNATSWSAYLAEYDKYVALCEAVETQASKEYKEAVSDAETAIRALGTVENSKAFEAKLAAAKEALEAVDDKYEAMLPAEQAEATGVSNEDVYDEAVYELAYLQYLASLSETPTTLPTVNAFYEIARGITDARVIKYYAKADQNKILEIVTEARDAIDAASTDTAKVSVAEKAIEDLKAIATVVDNTDYNAALAANKAEATKYFDKYYNTAFSSEATTATALIEEIIALNEDLVPDPAAEAMKAAVYGTHVKIWSSSGKGYIKIRWDQNDNGVTLDGYEVYRSTKKTTGFSKISTFKVQKQKTYKINMKKGTKYYFKVKGYKMVGDEKVYAHDSITVYRTFR